MFLSDTICILNLILTLLNPPELEDRPPIRTIEAYKRVRNEDELKKVVEDDRFLETPYKKGFQTWEEFKSTVYPTFRIFKYNITLNLNL